MLGSSVVDQVLGPGWPRARDSPASARIRSVHTMPGSFSDVMQILISHSWLLEHVFLTKASCQHVLP
jgi:hypothetical protein